MADFGPTTINGDIDIRGSIGGAVRKAFVATTPTTGSTFSAFLDTDAIGESITVTCSIVDGSDLNASTPLLTDGDTVFVAKMQDTWYCLTVFYTT